MSTRGATARPVRRTTAARRPPARRPSSRRRPAGGGGRGAPGGTWRSWLPLGLVALVVLGVVALVRNTAGPEPVALTGSCTVAGTGLELSAEQAASAATIAAVGRVRGLPQRAVVIALATAQQESTMRNLDYGDRDSLGLFQQRPSQGWGSPEQVTDPVYAAGQFYDGLVEVRGWETRRLTEAADAVQRSAFPEAYQKHAALAEQLTAALTADEPGRLDCRYEPPVPGGRLSQRVTSVAAVVERELGATTTERFGAVEVDPAAGWPTATWAVAHAERLGLRSVSFAGSQWTPVEGWGPADAGPDTVRLELSR
ncbi:hypothetical protein SAMN06893096_103105 [Geodermatophilus pulveris]|uniref:Heavy metal transporter n=1 Tax=Geodermatophilus pulveris TaxID=1564159 RepID=A0A239DB88_9ACTN|nr:hypothetical protein [Geodermatophilus pulveris]SNS29666.1 hypothetical protein SAMN06893096_103105 [Geodermatophilus pulveris]